MGNNNFNKLNKVFLMSSLGLGLMACNEDASSNNQGDIADLKALTASFEALQAPLTQHTQQIQTIEVKTQTLESKSQETEERVAALENQGQAFADAQCNLRKVAKGSAVKMSVGQQIAFVAASRSGIVERVKFLSIDRIPQEDCDPSEPGQICLHTNLFNFEIQSINLADCRTIGDPRTRTIEYSVGDQADIYIINVLGDNQTIIATLLENAI